MYVLVCIRRFKHGRESGLYRERGQIVFFNHHREAKQAIADFKLDPPIEREADELSYPMYRISHVDVLPGRLKDELPEEFR